jgi:hypothetical protein
MKTTALSVWLMLTIAAPAVRAQSAGGPGAGAPAASLPLPPPPANGAFAASGEKPVETLLAGPVTHGGFGGPLLGYTRLNGADAVMVGGRGGWLINHRLVIGGGGWGVASRVPVPAGATANEADHQLVLGYGGFWTEYIVAPGRLLHGSVAVLVGAGGLTYTRFRGPTGVEDRETESDPIFVLEPSVNAELNLTGFMRLAMFVGYRAVSGVDLTGLSTRDVAGFVGGAMLKFGVF